MTTPAGGPSNPVGGSLPLLTLTRACRMLLDVPGAPEALLFPFCLASGNRHPAILSASRFVPIKRWFR